MVQLKKYIFETRKMLLLLFLTFLFCDVIAYESASYEDLQSSEESKKIRNNLDGYGYYNRYSNMDDSTVKRALTLLAHWRPQYFRSSGINTRSDIMSRGSHVRPLGQPLRWG